MEPEYRNTTLEGKVVVKERNAMPEALNVSYEQLQELLRGVLDHSQKLNPIEQKKLDEEMGKERRRTRIAIEQGYIEDLKRWNKQQGCSHCRWPMSAGTNAGQMAPRGQGEWMTSGQSHGDGTITLQCQRCNTTWRFKATNAELQYCIDAEHGLMGFVPPPLERCVNRKDFLLKPPVKPAILVEEERKYKEQEELSILEAATRP